MEANRLEQAGCPPPDAQASAAIGDPAVMKQPASPTSTSQRAAAQRRRAAVARLLRMGVSDGAKSSSGATAETSELETELALLREENAQLKVERHRPADVGHVIERMRSLRLDSPEQQTGVSSPAAEAVAECLAVREGLMQACQEVQQAMRGIRGRLGALAGDIHSRPGDGAVQDGLAASVSKTVDIEPAVATATQPELVQSVA